MTLQTYDPQKLDDFALRLFDLAAICREMATLSREHGITDVALHDKKALESCEKLDKWAKQTRAGLNARIDHEKTTRQRRKSAE